jgi:uncharacterized coiled-coil protein SlyX
MNASEEVLRLRNLVKESTLKRLFTAFLAHQSLHANAHALADDLARADAELALALEAQQLVLAKQASLCHTYERDAALAHERCGELEAETAATQTAIRALAHQLTNERVARSNKEEYAALAKVVLALPPRHEVEAEVLALEAQRDALLAHGAVLERRRAARERQFSVLLHAIADLQTEFDQEQATTAAVTDMLED